MKVTGDLKMQYLIMMCCQMLFGYSLGWSSPILPKLENSSETPLPNLITEEQGSWIASLMFIGQIIGPFLTGYLSNSKGRKISLLLSGFLIFISFSLLAIARNITMMYTGRIIGGLGTGIMQVLNILYIGELASTEIRGVLLTMLGIFNGFATLVVFAVAPFISYAEVSYIGMTLAIIHILGVMFVVPESPIFLALKGRETELKDVLMKLGRSNDINEVLNMKAESKTQTVESDWKQLFTVKSNRKALIITTSLLGLAQLSGAMAVIAYTTSIFEKTGSSITPHIATIIVGVTQVATSCITPVFVERMGRKTLLLISAPICAVFLAILGTYFYLDEINSDIVESIKWVPLASVVAYFIGLNLGLSVIPGALLGEMFEPNVRSIGSTVAISVSWICGFAASLSFGQLLPILGGHVIFWIFTIPCIFALIFTIIFVPETKGKSLSEIQEMLRK